MRIGFRFRALRADIPGYTIPRAYGHGPVNKDVSPFGWAFILDRRGCKMPRGQSPGLFVVLGLLRYSTAP